MFQRMAYRMGWVDGDGMVRQTDKHQVSILRGGAGCLVAGVVTLEGCAGRSVEW